MTPDFAEQFGSSDAAIQAHQATLPSPPPAGVLHTVNSSDGAGPTVVSKATRAAVTRRPAPNSQRGLQRLGSGTFAASGFKPRAKHIAKPFADSARLPAARQSTLPRPVPKAISGKVASPPLRQQKAAPAARTPGPVPPSLAKRAVPRQRKAAAAARTAMPSLPTRKREAASASEEARPQKKAELKSARTPAKVQPDRATCRPRRCRPCRRRLALMPFTSLPPHPRPAPAIARPAAGPERASAARCRSRRTRCSARRGWRRARRRRCTPRHTPPPFHPTPRRAASGAEGQHVHVHVRRRKAWCCLARAMAT